MSKVIIIIVNWNGWKDTIECLESLLVLDYHDFRIVVCDNGSNDDSVMQLRNWGNKTFDLTPTDWQELNRDEAEKGLGVCNCKFTLIVNKNNIGFAGGNNVGLRYALACENVDFCWLLNNDTVVKTDSLTHLVKRVEETPQIGICGSTILYFNNRKKIQTLGGGHYCRWIGLPWHYGRYLNFSKTINQKRAESFMNYVEGASMLVSHNFLKEIGLLCEDYFLYFEEPDWAIRAKGCFIIGYAPLSVVYHKVGGSIGTSSNPAKMSYISDYFNIRNRLLFTRRFYPVALPTVWLVIVGALLLRLCLGEWDRAKMIFSFLVGTAEKHYEIPGNGRITS